MRYYLDTEFNEFGGELISLALACEDGSELYVAQHCQKPGPWVSLNVMPILHCEGAEPIWIDRSDFGHAIFAYLARDINPSIVADWPDDISYFCKAMITGPGQMVAISTLRFDLARIDAYPTTLPGAVQHNALWDARALRHAMS
jgi:hypothetical protein